MVGLLDGYANQSQEGFLREAQTFNNPGAQTPAPPQQAPQPEQPQEQVATTISWSDEGQNLQQPTQEPVAAPDPEAPSGPPSDTQVASTSAKAVKTQLEGKTDAKTVKAASEWMGDSTGIADAIAKLDAGIEKQETRRDSMKLMMFGLSMLSGEGVAKSVQAANLVGGFNEQRINALYDQRKTIQDKVTKAALDQALPQGQAQSNEFGVGWEADDGEIYFNPNDVPPGVKIVGKAGTKNPDVPTKWVGVQTKAIEDIASIDARRAQIANITANVPENAWSGIFGSGAASIKDILGTQDAARNWRTEVAKLRNEIAIGDLPPGVASDKDIALVLKGTPDTFTNPEALRQYLRGVEKLANYQKRYKQGLVDFIEANSTASGFEPPEYEPQGADQAQIGVTTGGDNIDFDFSK